MDCGGGGIDEIMDFLRPAAKGPGNPKSCQQRNERQERQGSRTSGIMGRSLARQFSKRHPIRLDFRSDRNVHTVLLVLNVDDEKNIRDDDVC